MAFEGLNNAGTLHRQLLVVLNDNGMSISKPQGAFSQYLERVRVSTTYEEFKKLSKNVVEHLPTSVGSTIEALWQGIWAYINHYGIGVMTGCASFHGIVPAAHAEALTYLAHHCRTDQAWDVRAVAGRYCSMDLMPIEAVNAKAAIAAMPPLVKGYLRVGARIGDGCVIDHEFSTVDVFVVMPVKEIGARYVNYYGGEGQRFAA